MSIPASQILPYDALQPITRPLPRRISPGSWLWDRIALHKTLLLCSTCTQKLALPRPDIEYKELRQFHARGLCDGCQHEDEAGLWLWEGSALWHQYTLADQIEAIKQREREMGQRI